MKQPQPLRIGSNVRVRKGNLEGAIGTVVDDGTLPELPDMVRVELPNQSPPKWWIDPDNLETVG